MGDLAPMKRALEMARRAATMGEVPIGAVLVYQGKIIIESYNLCESLGDPTAHAELVALKLGFDLLKKQRLDDCDLYVTLEPCPMCAGAIAHARIRRLYFGAYDPKSGGVAHGACVFDHSQSHHKPEVYGGMDESEAGEILKDFFKEKRI